MRRLYSSWFFKDYTWLLMLIVVVVVGGFWAGAWSLFSEIDAIAEEHNSTDFTSPKLTLGVVSLIVIIGLLSNCVIYTAVYPNAIRVQRSFIPIFSWTISKDKVMAVQVAEKPMRAYFPNDFAFGWGYTHLDGAQWGPNWRIIAFPGKRKALLIKTDQRKYMISCNDPEKAVEIIRREYGVPDGPVTPQPPTWDDR